MAAARPVSVCEQLHDAPRSLRSLSLEHGDGWGAALRVAGDWRVHRSTACAARCDRFDELRTQETTLAIAHVRKKTVGGLSLANTHPFRRGDFVLAHNGTILAVPALVARTSAARLAEIEGDTDSERLFAFLMTCVDDARDTATGIATGVRALHAIAGLGSANFLISDGQRLYAHRLGRSLYTLARGEVAMVASERLTDEAWLEVPDATLLTLDVAVLTAVAA